MLTRVHHVGLVVRRLEDGLAFWRDTLGLRVAKEATVKDQGVRAALLPIGRSEIELLEPIDAAGGVAKFLARRGEGLHHICFETPDVTAELGAARAKNLPLIDQAPRQGLAGMICFLHPKGTCGVLVEFATPPPDAPHSASAGGAFAGLALREVTARTLDASNAADLFAAKLGLTAAATRGEPGLTAAAVETGGVLLRFVAPDPRAADAEATAAAREAIEAAGEGLASLVLEVGDPVAAADALARLEPVREAVGFRLDADRCHGVPVRFQAG
jgi:methylmalonyl-CoA/ethylmalonyl-CoA epimerase